MNISPALPPAQVAEIAQVLLLKKALTIEATKNQALIESTMLTAANESSDSGSPGRIINEKV